MNESEAKVLVFDILSSIAPEADFAGLRGHAGQSDELDLDSVDFLNFITFCTNVPDQHLRGR